MATLILSAVGTFFGGRIGGAIGALFGQQIDGAILGSPSRKGPRLKDLSVQTSSYGAPIPRHYGRMRVAGSVIWSTDLKESREKKGGGKGKPKVVTYTYSASFAVALASRPIQGIGRIWADGNLLRGAAGDLKTGGELRVHLGHADQPTDPLLAAAEGAGTCPAFRNVAYLVFEDLALAEFGNRIPSLTVEVFADAGPVAFETVLADLLPEAEVGSCGLSVEGYSHDGGNVAAVVDELADLAPLVCIADGTGLVLRQAPTLGEAALLPEPLAVVAGNDAPPRAALTRRIDPLPGQRDVALRYYDVDRDYQPGIQRARGQAHRGEVAVSEFAAALTAGQAAGLAGSIAMLREDRRINATARIAAGSAGFAPGGDVRLAGEPGRWLVSSWELDQQGIALELRRAPRQPAIADGDPGRASLPGDHLPAPTMLAAFELPWDGIGSSQEHRVFAALSASGRGWTGAALFVARGEALEPLGGSGRTRAVMGTALTVLGVAPAAALDRINAVDVELAASDLGLAGADARQLANGANRALLGDEMIQFARAQPLGSRRWRLSGLLRGRGGTEWAVHGHAIGERFVPIDDSLVALDSAAIGDTATAQIAALGLADSEPILSAIGLAGTTLLPLSPVHGRLVVAADGSLALSWMRRARGAWLWRDQVDVPLVEQAESYRVALGDTASPAAQWEVATTGLTIAPELAATLRTQAPGAAFTVQQRGDRGLSPPLRLGVLS